MPLFLWSWLLIEFYSSPLISIFDSNLKNDKIQLKPKKEKKKKNFQKHIDVRTISNRLCKTKIAIRITLFCWYRKYCKLIGNRHPEDTSFQICTTSNHICTTACVYRKSPNCFTASNEISGKAAKKRQKVNLCKGMRCHFVIFYENIL